MESLIKYKEGHIYILQENQSLKEEINKLTHESTEFESKTYELKDRIEKSIEEIYYNCDLTVYQGEKLKQILKGSDK